MSDMERQEIVHGIGNNMQVKIYSAGCTAHNVRRAKVMLKLF
jgi:hypothetical protein